MNHSIEGSLAEISRGAQIPTATLIAKGESIQTQCRLYEYAKDNDRKLAPDDTLSFNTIFLLVLTAFFCFISGVVMILLDWFDPVVVSLQLPWFI